MVEIKLFNKSQLFEYIYSSDFGNSNCIPITIHRALSQFKNTKLHEEDVILLIAFCNGNVIGYLGVLPDILSFNNNVIRIGWLSCLRVSDEFRGNGISYNLIIKALELWDNKLLTSDYVSYTKKIYDKTKLFNLKPYVKKGIRLYLKSDMQNILPPKKPFLSKFLFLFKILDFILNAFLNLRILLFYKFHTNFDFEYTNYADDEINDFIKSKQNNQLFKKDKNDLNWIIQNPWVLSEDKKSNLNKKYYFSSTVNLFRFHLIKIKNKRKELVGVILFSEKDKSLKIPYIYHNNIDCIIETIYFHVHVWKIKTLTTFNIEIVEGLKKGKSHPEVLKKEIIRNYIVSNPLSEYLFSPEIIIQDGDGDSVFT
ncbi:MAG TPA: hypothetical protein PK199_01085 [Bacteroidales bacterium]|nr:hypothetical protein [Bacteroidales bacterium]